MVEFYSPQTYWTVVSALEWTLNNTLNWSQQSSAKILTRNTNLDFRYFIKPRHESHIWFNTAEAGESLQSKFCFVRLGCFTLVLQRSTRAIYGCPFSHFIFFSFLQSCFAIEYVAIFWQYFALCKKSKARLRILQGNFKTKLQTGLFQLFQTFCSRLPYSFVFSRTKFIWLYRTYELEDYRSLCQVLQLACGNQGRAFL